MIGLDAIESNSANFLTIILFFFCSLYIKRVYEEQIRDLDPESPERVRFKYLVFQMRPLWSFLDALSMQFPLVLAFTIAVLAIHWQISLVMSLNLIALVIYFILVSLACY